MPYAQQKECLNKGIHLCCEYHWISIHVLTYADTADIRESLKAFHLTIVLLSGIAWGRNNSKGFQLLVSGWTAFSNSASDSKKYLPIYFLKTSSLIYLCEMECRGWVRGSMSATVIRIFYFLILILIFNFSRHFLEGGGQTRNGETQRRNDMQQWVTEPPSLQQGPLPPHMGHLLNHNVP